MTLESRLAAGLAEMDLQVDVATRERLIAYLRLIEKWNNVHNLTAIRDTEQMVVLHLLDSLSVLPHVGAARTLLDVGSGAGLPGVPLAIVNRDLRVTVLDSSHKKAAFLAQAKAELAPDNLEVVCQRVEQWRPGAKFDLVVSRAFADLTDFVALARHVVKPGGAMLAMKGVHPLEEIARLPGSHRIERVVELHVPTLGAQRHLVFLRAA